MGKRTKAEKKKKSEEMSNEYRSQCKWRGSEGKKVAKPEGKRSKILEKGEEKIRGELVD